MTDDTTPTEITLYELLRPEIRRIANLMERRFQLHASRGDPFQPRTWGFLKRREEEVDLKFFAAMQENKIPSEVMEIAADKMNFILMQVIKYEKEWKPREPLDLICDKIYPHPREKKK